MSALPHPRNSPLKSGGNKESAFIRHVDSQITNIQRRFAKRTNFSTAINEKGEVNVPADTWAGDVKGYASMKQACKEIEQVVDVVWVSGTPSLQVPYLLSLALLLTTVVSGMPPSPKRLFRLLGKLDRAFASLIQGRDVETGEMLPGFGGRKGLSGTEKVRIRSLVERTRLGVMEAFKKGEFEDDDEGGVDEDDGKMETDTEGELIVEDEDDEEDDASWDMQLARVYDRTVVELGDSLEAPNIGIITEGRE